MQLKAKILSSKTIILLILQMFIIHVYVQPLADCAKSYNYPCAPWILPFYFSSSSVILINMFMIIYYFSDVPFMQYYNLYHIVRYGRIRYAVSNIIAIIIESVLYMITSFVFGIVCLAGHIDYTVSWGKLLYTIGVTKETMNIDIFMDVSYNMMAQYSPLAATGLMILLGVLVFSLIGMVMYIISLFFSRTVAIVSVLVMTAMGYAALEALPVIGKILSYFSPVSWLYITKINNTYLGRYTLPDWRYIFVFLAGGIGICIFLIIYKSKTVEYEFYKED